MTDEKNVIKIFQDRKIRSVWNPEEEQWYFSIVDIIAVLTESANPNNYWKVLKSRLIKEGNQSVTTCNQLKMASPKDGKYYKTDVLNTKQLFRLVQSIPSPKAEPFKVWLAEVGYDRVLEIEDPERAQERMKDLYEQKGYSKDWIDKRLRGIAIRQNLTDEWKERGISSEKDFAILTAEISNAAFGMTPSEYKEFKGLARKNENLRDHMTDLELIFTMLGERVTTEISETEKPSGLPANKIVARRGGNVAGVSRRETEKELGHPVSSPENYLNEKPKKRLKDMDE